jgi:hypothetical protein
LPLPRSTSCGGPPRDKRPTATAKSLPSFDGDGRRCFKPLLKPGPVLFSIVAGVGHMYHRRRRRRGHGGGDDGPTTLKGGAAASELQG